MGREGLTIQTDLRLAIIGAGPAGLTIAWYLSRLGFASVELYDAADQIGGQSITLHPGDVPVELGTCYLADGYVIEREIADAAGTPAKRLPPATFIDCKGRAYKPEMPSMLSMLKYVFHWFGWYLTGQLWKPTNSQYTLTFYDWLKKKGLSDLATSSVFADACTAQLYGPLDKVTAQNGLSWVRPTLLITGRFEHTAQIPAGFQVMWQRLLTKLDYPAHLNCPVSEVRPGEVGSGVDLVLANGEVRRYDHAFIACPLDEQSDDSHTPLRHPLSEMLRNDFPPYDATETYSAVWQAADWPLAVRSRAYLPACTKGDPGRLLTIRQSGKVGDEWVGQLCSYASDDAVPKDYDAALRHNRELVIEDMQTIVGLKDVQIIDDRLWRYGVRFSADQLDQGLPAALAARQGEGNVWYAGGAFGHWDVDMIANFDQCLVWRFAKQAGLSLFARLHLIRLRDIFKDL